MIPFARQIADALPVIQTARLRRCAQTLAARLDAVRDTLAANPNDDDTQVWPHGRGVIA